MSQSMFVAIPRGNGEEYINLALMHTVEIHSAEHCIIEGWIGGKKFHKEVTAREYVSAILRKLRGLDETKTDEEIRPQRP